MKQISVYAVLLLIGISACKKEEKKEVQKPTPELQITFGYGMSFSGMTPWVNQNTILVDSVKKYDHFGISIVETNLGSYHGFTMDSGIIEFNARTKNDEELFNFDKNIDIRSMHTMDAFGLYEFGAEALLPYKITETAVKGNDTLEISNLGDAIRVNYSSRYTGLIGADSISINP